ncbi:MAG: DNA polymerase, partial [Patescibacteria group bacterium]
MKSLLLIDAHALIHRSFHAIPPLTTPNGEPIGAIYGLTRALMKTMREHEPDYVAAAFDRPEPTFRKEMFDGYKAQRPKAPDELVSQLIKARELFQKLNIPCFELAGFEGDDIIGTLAEKFGKYENLQITILTGDMDTLQLVKGTHIVVRTPKKGVSETITYDDEAVRARYELGPDQMTDYKGLVGDPSDNIPGVPGVGPKTALEALKEFSTIENLYAKMESTHKLAKKFLPFKENAFFSKKLATIHTAVPIKVVLADLEYKKPGDVDIQAYFLSLGFESMAGGKPKIEKTEKLRFEKPQTLDLHFKKDNFVVLANTKDAQRLAYKLQNTKPKIAFDWKPFLKKLTKEDVEICDPLFDIHIASWLVSPDKKDASFHELALEIMGIDIETSPDKTEDALEILAGVFEEKIKKNNLEKVFYEIEMPLIRVLAGMETRGITIDAETLKVLGKEMRSELSLLEKQIYDVASGPFNINSPQQISEVLFERLKIETHTKKRTATGQRKTGKDILTELVGAHPIVPLILQYRETFKVFSGFLTPLSEMSALDGKVHTTYLQTGAGTGRLSSEKPNLQNIPNGGKWAKELRDAFLP